MRNYLFRGLSSKGLVYGCYAIVQDGFGLATPCIYEIDIDSFIPVDKETVGQYTGLKDVHGTKIFEGDIVEVDGEIFGYVYWCDNLGEYRIKGEKYRPLSFIWKDLVVIGNMASHSYLLEDIL